VGLFSLRTVQRDDTSREASRRIAALVREILALGEEDAVTVSQIACGDPVCGGAETVVLVMRKGHRTAAMKMRMPMASVGEAEIRAAWAESGAK
jgi:hypothetical protein